MISTRSGAASIWIWEVSTQRLHSLLSKDGNERVDLAHPSFEWIDEDHIVCALTHEAPGSKSKPDDSTVTTRVLAPHEWEKWATGKTATSSVLESGDAIDDRAQSSGQIAIVNANTGRIELVRDSVDATLGTRRETIAICSPGGCAAFRVAIC
jgi:hypothetical protein